MRLLGLFLLLLVCEFAWPIPIADKGDDAGLRRVSRSAGVGETLRDWIRILKNRIVGTWNEWFGDTRPTLNFTPQDILNIDKTIESRVSGYPGVFFDLSDLAFDPKQDWGVRLGNWYIIRKITGNNYNPSNDEWDIKELVPGSIIPKFDWVPSILDIPEDTQPPTPTSEVVGVTTTERQIPQTVPQTESTLPSTESTEPVESTITSEEQIPATTQLIATSSELTTTQEAVISSESSVTNDEPVTVPVEPTSTESLATSGDVESDVDLTIVDSTTIPIETMIETTETVPITTVTNATSNEMTTESTVKESTEESSTITAAAATTTTATTTTTTTESVATSTFNLPVLNKRVEDNETVNRRPTKKPRRSSAEVIMF